jgi:hypothetical protein
MTSRCLSFQWLEHQSGLTTEVSEHSITHRSCTNHVTMCYTMCDVCYCGNCRFHCTAPLYSTPSWLMIYAPRPHRPHLPLALYECRRSVTHVCHRARCCGHQGCARTRCVQTLRLVQSQCSMCYMHAACACMHTINMHMRTLDAPHAHHHSDCVCEMTCVQTRGRVITTDTRSKCMLSIHIAQHAPLCATAAHSGARTIQ